MQVDPWDVVREWTDKLPPMLADDDVTVERYYEKFKDKFKNREAARSELEKMVGEGRLVKSPRRTRKGGTRPMVYEVPGA